MDRISFLNDQHLEQCPIIRVATRGLREVLLLVLAMRMTVLAFRKMEKIVAAWCYSQ